MADTNFQATEMKGQAPATPRPWVIGGPGARIVGVGDVVNADFCALTFISAPGRGRYHDVTPEEDRANAELVVHAVNAHDAVVAALRAALAYDAAISRRAQDGDYKVIDPQGAIAEGADLDGLYMDWIGKSENALALLVGHEARA